MLPVATFTGPTEWLRGELWPPRWVAISSYYREPTGGRGGLKGGVGKEAD